MFLNKLYSHKYEKSRRLNFRIDLLIIDPFIFLAKVFDVDLIIYCKIKNYSYVCGHRSPFGNWPTGKFPGIPPVSLALA